MTTPFAHFSPIANEIWDMKYRLKAADGTPVDRTVEDTWRRVSCAAAQVEKASERKVWAKRFFKAMSDFAFLPAGRILAGAGTKRSVTLFNCFVMGVIEDDMASIFDNVKEAALTMQQGGGIGHDFSTLRPWGAEVKGVGADASGPVSFMSVWDAMCRTIMSAGARRGAMMGTLRCDHPDIEWFISAKSAKENLRMFNLSVLVTGSFMDAVAQDEDWNLVFAGKVYRTVRARDLWDKIMRATYDYAEPGVIFIDRVNALNNLSYCETIAAANPCGEQPLPPYGACLLGSINLAALVDKPFEDDTGLDEVRLETLVETGVRFLDNIIDVSRFPLKRQKEEARAKRRIGLGITGLADALAMCRIAYGSEDSFVRAKRWMSLIERAAYRTSAKLAEEKGVFALFDKETMLASPNIRRLDDGLKKLIGRNGLRNGTLTSIAPAGTISLLAGNISSGIEPVFDFVHQRKILLPDGTVRDEMLENFATRMFREKFGANARLPDYFVSTDMLRPEQHIEMQAALQRHVDSSISKTINCPQDISFDAFKGIYAAAYELGLKGCTTFRPNEVTGSVLSSVSNGQGKPLQKAQAEGTSDFREIAPVQEGTDGEIVYMSQPLERDPVLSGYTYKLKWDDSDHAIYVTINDIIQDGRRRPFEVFINSKNLEHCAWTVALTRMISAVFRRGGDVSFVVEELKAVLDPRGGQWMQGHYVPSLLAAVGGIIENHMIDIGFILPREIEEDEAQNKDQKVRELSGLRVCPRCHSAKFFFLEGCHTCRSCGFSKCG